MIQPWFTRAKLGIFVHWGLYSVDGVPESWCLWHDSVSQEDYYGQAQRFTAAKYDPQHWAEVFERAGAKYAVLTTKHHDGFALWPTKHRVENSVQQTPASAASCAKSGKSDLVGPYCQAMRDQGLKVGLYYSILDWSHPDYASIRRDGDMLDEHGGPAKPGHKLAECAPGQQDYARWDTFCKFNEAQLREITEGYKPDLLWFDGDWERTAEQWRARDLREKLHQWSPEVVINSRLQGYGDYQTPEQGVPITRPDGPWEWCVTVNDSWGYQKGDTNHKSTRQIVRMFCDCISKGGNMLLDVGPFEDGTLQPEQEQRLLELGDWIRPRSEAIYDTTDGLPNGLYHGGSTLSEDRQTLYLFEYNRPWDQIKLQGIHNKPRKISILGGPCAGRELTWKAVGGAVWLNIPGNLWIDVPEEACDPLATCIKIEFDKPLDLYAGSGQAISQN